MLPRRVHLLSTGAVAALAERCIVADVSAGYWLAPRSLQGALGAEVGADFLLPVPF